MLRKTGWPGPMALSLKQTMPGMPAIVEAAVFRVLEPRDLALEEVRVADEGRDEARPRGLVDLDGRADLLDPPRIHDGDAVAEAHGLALVMGDVEERDADLVVDHVELDEHPLAELEVEGGQRLVEEEHPGPVDEGPGDGDALFLPAREEVRLLCRLVGHADEAEHPVDLVVDLALRPLGDAQAEGDVLPDAHVREQGVALEDGVDLALFGGEVRDVLAVEEDAPRIRALEPGGDAQHRRLAAAARTEEGEDLAFPDLERNVGDGLNGPEPLRDASKFQELVQPP